MAKSTIKFEKMDAGQYYVYMDGKFIAEIVKTEGLRDYTIVTSYGDEFSGFYTLKSAKDAIKNLSADLEIMFAGFYVAYLVQRHEAKQQAEQAAAIEHYAMDSNSDAVGVSVVCEQADGIYCSISMPAAEQAAAIEQPTTTEAPVALTCEQRAKTVAVQALFELRNGDYELSGAAWRSVNEALYSESLAMMLEVLRNLRANSYGSTYIRAREACDAIQDILQQGEQIAPSSEEVEAQDDSATQAQPEQFSERVQALGDAMFVPASVTVSTGELSIGAEPRPCGKVAVIIDGEQVGYVLPDESGDTVGCYNTYGTLLGIERSVGAAIEFMREHKSQHTNNLKRYSAQNNALVREELPYTGAAIPQALKNKCQYSPFRDSIELSSFPALAQELGDLLLNAGNRSINYCATFYNYECNTAAMLFAAYTASAKNESSDGTFLGFYVVGSINSKGHKSFHIKETLAYEALASIF